MDDFLVDVLDGVPPEGREATHHLVEHAAQGPPVHLVRVRVRVGVGVRARARARVRATVRV